jgi:predicted DNA-binding transcriptional regulator YafY
MANTAYERMLAGIPSGLDGATLRVLVHHVGRGNAIGRADLVDALRGKGFDVQERMVRRCIHDLRRAGKLVCSAPGDNGGYFMAESLAEFREFCDRELHPKAMDLLETESAMKEAARQLFGDAYQAQLI